LNFDWGSRKDGNRLFPNLRIPQSLWGVSTDTTLARDIRIVEGLALMTASGRNVISASLNR